MVFVQHNDTVWKVSVRRIRPQPQATMSSTPQRMQLALLVQEHCVSIAASHHHNPMRELERHRWETGHPFLVHASTLPIAVVARGIARTVREQDGVTSSEVNGFNGKTRIGKRDVGVLFADDTVSRDDLVKGAGAKTDQFVVCGVHVGRCLWRSRE